MQQTEAISNTRQAIAGAVRAELARRRISQQALRDTTGWSKSSLSRRLNGDVDFSITELAVLAESIGANPLDLIEIGLCANGDPGSRPSGGAGTGPGRYEATS